MITPLVWVLSVRRVRNGGRLVCVGWNATKQCAIPKGVDFVRMLTLWTLRCVWLLEALSASVGIKTSNMQHRTAWPNKSRRIRYSMSVMHASWALANESPSVPMQSLRQLHHTHNAQDREMNNLSLFRLHTDGHYHLIRIR